MGGHGAILRTEDGGGRWAAVRSPTSETLVAVARNSGKTILAVGLKGAALTSADRGKSWQALELGVKGDSRALTAGGSFFYAVVGKANCVRIAVP